MPLALLLVALDAMFIVHAAKTGRLCPWAYIILSIPGIGVIAYVAVELVPEWMASIGGQKARRRIADRLHPEKRHQALAEQLRIADTIQNRVALAEECLARAKFREARQHYDAVLARPLGDEPQFALGKARAEFGLGHMDETLATLDALRRRWPDYQSAEGHLIYARALDDSGRPEEALIEYQALATYYPGAEARVRYGLLLARLGYRVEAKTLLAETLSELKRAPKFVRKAQAEWIATAEKALRAS
jgi:hypothetical protein